MRFLPGEIAVRPVLSFASVQGDEFSLLLGGTTMTANTAASTLSTSGLKAGALLPSMMSVLFGLFMIGFVGFSQLDVVHNAAHDTRHANAFPCH